MVAEPSALIPQLCRPRDKTASAAMAQPRDLPTAEEDVLDMEPRTPVAAPSVGSSGRGDNSPAEGSTPGSGAELTQRDLQRVKRRFVSVSEHLREFIAETREALSPTSDAAFGGSLREFPA